MDGTLRLRDVLRDKTKGDRRIYDRLLSVLQIPATASNEKVIGQLLEQCEDVVDDLVLGDVAQFARTVLLCVKKFDDEQSAMTKTESCDLTQMPTGTQVEIASTSTCVVSPQDELAQIEIERVQRGKAQKETLDKCLSDLLTIVFNVATGKIDYGNSANSDKNESSTNAEKSGNEQKMGTNLSALHVLFEETISIFEAHVLTATSARTVPSFWFYLCSFDESLPSAFCNYLWHLSCGLTAPQSGKKSSDKKGVDEKEHDKNAGTGNRVGHSAVCHLACFLARHKCMDLTILLRWIDEMVEFAHRYQNNVEVVNSGDEAMPKIIAFRLEQITHHPLNPLRYASQQVVKSFASLCRSIQLVYCMGQIQKNRLTRRPYDLDPFEVQWVYEKCDHLECTWSKLCQMHRNLLICEYDGITPEMLASEYKWNKRVRLISGTEPDDIESETYDYLSHYVEKPSKVAKMDGTLTAALHGDENALISTFLQ